MVRAEPAMTAKARKARVLGLLRHLKAGSALTGEEPLWLLAAVRDHRHCGEGLRFGIQCGIDMHPDKLEADGVTPKAWRDE